MCLYPRLNYIAKSCAKLLLYLGQPLATRSQLDITNFMNNSIIATLRGTDCTIAHTAIQIQNQDKASPLATKSTMRNTTTTGLH